MCLMLDSLVIVRLHPFFSLRFVHLNINRPSQSSEIHPTVSIYSLLSPTQIIEIPINHLFFQTTHTVPSFHNSFQL